jgi:hypothetical protein
LGECMRWTPFKQGRKDGSKGNVCRNYDFRGRKRLDYEHGYSQGIYLLYYRGLTCASNVKD